MLCSISNQTIRTGEGNYLVVRRRGMLLQSRSFALWNQSLRHNPTPTGLAKIASDYFRVPHALHALRINHLQTPQVPPRLAQCPQ